MAGHKSLTEEDKIKVINENLSKFSEGKSQETIDTFNAKDTNKRYTAILGFIRKNSEPKKEKATENISVVDVFGKVLKQTTETSELFALKEAIISFIPRIEEKIEANKKKDDIAKLEKAIEAMKAANIDTTEAENRLTTLRETK